MVAYSFKRQFEGAIRAGEKRQTIRANRKRHARPGEPIQLYTGMRTRSCRKIGDAVCVSIEAIVIDFGDSCQCPVVEICGRPAIVFDYELDAFARSDGFPDWRALADFWAETHDTETDWAGVLITWADFLPVTP